MDENYWEELYRTTVDLPLQPALTGFNVNLDRIIQVDTGLLDAPEFHKGDLAVLRSHLIHSMEHCTAEEWFVSNHEVYTRFREYFSNTGSLAMGGQAGIAALSLARIGAPEVWCLAPALGPQAAEMLKEGGVQVPEPATATGLRRDDIHLIFEYHPGLVPLARGALPRNNRFIASPEKTAANTLLPDESLRSILPEISACTRAFLSGYQYLHNDEEFIRAREQIRMLKTCNPQMRVHIECVSVTDANILEGLVHYILPSADSAGMNEHELGLLLGRTDLSSPILLVKGVLDLAQKTGLARIHLHTFGYYLLVIRKDVRAPEESRDALLSAARVVADAAGGTGTTISPVGTDAVRQIGKVFGNGPEPGVISQGDYLVIAVPSLIASGITRTTGLGDILSSTAFVADPF